MTIAHFYNEIISTQEKLGGGKLRPHKIKARTRVEKQPRRRCGRRWDKMRSDKPSLFAGMCSLSLFAEKGEELTCRNL